MILVKMLLTVMQAVKEGKVDRNEWGKLKGVINWKDATRVLSIVTSIKQLLLLLILGDLLSNKVAIEKKANRECILKFFPHCTSLLDKDYHLEVMNRIQISISGQII